LPAAVNEQEDWKQNVICRNQAIKLIDLTERNGDFSPNNLRFGFGLV
jgi:hypothetical protein